jgi:tripartite-type tricarboxylate transporter receptor subunit TctC
MRATARLVTILTTVFWLLGVADVAGQQPAYPSQTVRWLVPYPAGGGIDAITRKLAAPMNEVLGTQSLVVENKPGASTNISADALAKAKPDGYTIMTADNASLIVNEHLFKTLTYSPAKDFAMVGPIGRLPIILCVTPALKITTYKDLHAWLAANPATANYASPGYGSPHHLSMELFKQTTGLKIELVPYQGIAPSFRDLTAGETKVMFVDLAAGKGQIASGAVVPIAIGTEQRHPTLPNVPTLAEVGVTGVVTYAYIGVIAPAGTPDPIRAKLNDALRAAIARPDVASWMTEVGFEPMNQSPEAFRAFTRTESERWGQVIAKTGLKLD